MRYLRVWCADQLIRELPDVTATNVSDTGALVVRLFGANVPGALAVVVFAPGAWTEVEELNGNPPAQPDEQQATEPEPAPPVVPGPFVPPEVYSAPTPDTEPPTAILAVGGLIGDNQRIHEAMQVLCLCTELRCPVVLNPSTKAERRWWQVRQRGGIIRGGPPATPEPRQQCVHDLGHEPRRTADGILAAHEYYEGGWPFGPHNHHKACPRHPDSYNRAPLAIAEGQPLDAAGVTAPDDVPAETGTDPAPHTIVRPYIARHHDTKPGQPLGRAALAATGDPEAEGLNYSRDMSVVGRCGRYSEVAAALGRVCELPGPHGGSCETGLPGGERVYW